MKKKIQIVVEGGVVRDIIPYNFTDEELKNLEVSVVDFDNLEAEFSEEELEVVNEVIEEGIYIGYVKRDENGNLMIVEELE